MVELPLSADYHKSFFATELARPVWAIRLNRFSLGLPLTVANLVSTVESLLFLIHSFGLLYHWRVNPWEYFVRFEWILSHDKSDYKTKSLSYVFSYSCGFNSTLICIFFRKCWKKIESNFKYTEIWIFNRHAFQNFNENYLNWTDSTWNSTEIIIDHNCWRIYKIY